MGKKVKRMSKDALSVTTLGVSNYVDKKLNPDMPDPEEPKVAPVADDSAIDLANKRKAAKRKTAGRVGTILTEGNSLG